MQIKKEFVDGIPCFLWRKTERQNLKTKTTRMTNITKSPWKPYKAYVKCLFISFVCFFFITIITIIVIPFFAFNNLMADMKLGHKLS
mgnify:CR=1 FL=1